MTTQLPLNVTIPKANVGLRNVVDEEVNLEEYGVHEDGPTPGLENEQSVVVPETRPTIPDKTISDTH